MSSEEISVVSARALEIELQCHCGLPNAIDAALLGTGKANPTEGSSDYRAVKERLGEWIEWSKLVGWRWQGVMGDG